MKRLENGLLENVNYVRDEKTSKINWFRMIPANYLYLNQDKKAKIEARIGRKINGPLQDSDLTDLNETDLVITLAGVRHLLDLRGYKSVKMVVGNSDPGYAAVSCEILFTPLEDNNTEQSFSACASAHTQSTKSWYQNYLVEAASNRAFCRCVRNFLGINVVAQDELGGASSESNDDQPVNMMSPSGLLKAAMGRSGKTFKDVVSMLNQKGYDTSKVTTISEIPANQILDILEKLN